MSPANGQGREPLDYAEAQAAQRGLVAARLRGAVPDLLWLLEHPPTITWGASGGLGNVLLDESALGARGVAVLRSERGGNVTFHEPGQLVGYPIVDLSSPGDRDLWAYLRRIEDALIAYLRGLGLEADRVAGRTGVWIPGTPPRKIAAMGVRASRWVTSHGFALNVQNALEGFRYIVPCGLADAEVTSLARELRLAAPSWDEVLTGVHAALEASLARPLRRIDGKEGLELARIEGSGT